MADMVSIGSKSDTGAGSKLKTGSLRRSYSFKNKRRKKKKDLELQIINILRGNNGKTN